MKKLCKKKKKRNNFQDVFVDWKKKKNRLLDYF